MSLFGQKNPLIYIGGKKAPMKKEDAKVAAWRREFEVRSFKSEEYGVKSEELRKARLTLNSAGGVLQGHPPSVSTPKYETADVQLADRSTRVPTFE